MKNIFISSFICCNVLLINLTAKAQNQDYVIINRGDTLYCNINTPFLSLSPNYKTAEMSESEKIDPYQIKEYYIAKKQMVYRSVYEPASNSVHFMLVIERGIINIYQYTKVEYIYLSSQPISSKIIYISKGSGAIANFKPKPFNYDETESSWTDEFAEMLKDKSDIYNEYIAEDKCNFKQIKKFAHLYNTSAALN